MKRINVKKLILPNIPYVFIALLATKVSEAVRLAPGSDASTKLLNIMTGLNTAFHSLVPSFHPIDLCVGIISQALVTGNGGRGEFRMIPDVIVVSLSQSTLFRGVPDPLNAGFVGHGLGDGFTLCRSGNWDAFAVDP